MNRRALIALRVRAAKERRDGRNRRQARKEGRDLEVLAMLEREGPEPSVGPTDLKQELVADIVSGMATRLTRRIP